MKKIIAFLMVFVIFISPVVSFADCEGIDTEIYAGSSENGHGLGCI